ncbi:MAG: glycosyltransferase family 2 protein [Lachnospiraceae bacterium]|nr:glycosyltransferase family 2 protein [Lachnospiraceae bacterium]
MDRLAIVIPCYNEEEMLPISLPRLTEFLSALMSRDKISKDSYLLLVDDGSKDKTWDQLREWHEKSDMVRALKLARNTGHQNALFSGMLTASKDADMIVSIDADLQDDYTKIEEMVDFYHEGCDIVYGVRSKRDSDSFFKRFTAESYYKLLNRMGVDCVYNHADFRLMSKRAVLQLAKYEEVNLYLRGIVPLIGYKSAVVEYERTKREAGESKYPFKKMLALAFDGITSFSVKPINYILGLGIIVLFICFVAAVYAFVSYFSGNVTEGWTSLILSIWFLGGVQLICLGVIGEYIGKTYKEVKRRPKYNIETYLSDEKDK